MTGREVHAGLREEGGVVADSDPVGNVSWSSYIGEEYRHPAQSVR